MTYTLRLRGSLFFSSLSQSFILCSSMYDCRQSHNVFCYLCEYHFNKNHLDSSFSDALTILVYSLVSYTLCLIPLITQQVLYQCFFSTSKYSLFLPALTVIFFFPTFAHISLPKSTTEINKQISVSIFGNCILRTKKCLICLCGTSRTLLVV